MSVSECAVIWKTEIADRNKQIFDLRNKGYTQIEIASKFGISGQRVGQILNNYSPHKPKNKDLLFLGCPRLKPEAQLLKKIMAQR